MFKVLLIAFLFLLASATTVQTASVSGPPKVVKRILPEKSHPFHHHRKGKIHCVEKCMEKVRDVRVKLCKKAYILGGLVRRCSIKKIKGLCSLKCKPGKKFCFNKCHSTTCGRDKVRTCKNYCSHGKECRKHCCWEYQKQCIFARLPGHFVERCSFITKQIPFKKCLKSCTKRIKIRTCAEKCRNVKVPEEYKRCLTFLVRKERHVRKCSVVGNRRICKKHCFKGKKNCRKICRETECEGRKVQICDWKCRRPTICHVHCCLEKQIKCLLERIPPEYKTKCQDLFKFKNVKRCFKKCHSKFIDIPVNNH